MLSIFTMLLLIFLTGCAATGPKLGQIEEKIPELHISKGRIFFYREDTLLGGGVRPNIKVNDQIVGESIPGGFFFIDRDPGKYRVSTSTEVEKTLLFKLESGQKRYVKTTLSMGALIARVSPSLVMPEQAELDLLSMNYTGNHDILVSHPKGLNNAPIVSRPTIAKETTRTLTPASAPLDASTAMARSATKTYEAIQPKAQEKISSGTPPKLGKWSYDAEKLASSQGCNSNHSGAWVVGKEEFGDIYQVNCADGNAVLVTCNRFECSLK
ncbi:DUF2846 domain-containing protein [Chitinimonas sp. PSY-7]|uniref:DUF2846 domain-containing protein n=1 Tax=Chitinimonas sp. PSY-7 TaxID=3459088 RepID=UPI004040249C